MASPPLTGKGTIIPAAIPGGRPAPPAGVRPWLGLALGLALLVFFIFVAAPWINKLPMVRPLAEYIEKTGMDAGALYYTEVEETGEAEMHMRETFEHTPVGP